VKKSEVRSPKSEVGSKKNGNAQQLKHYPLPLASANRIENKEEREEVGSRKSEE
jgi:hypothetical protein